MTNIINNPHTPKLFTPTLLGKIYSFFGTLLPLPALPQQDSIEFDDSERNKIDD